MTPVDGETNPAPACREGPGCLTELAGPTVPSLTKILETAPPLGPESDGAFLVELQRNGITSDQGRLMIPLAYTTCDTLAAGVSRDELIDSGTEQGMDAATGQVVTDAAIKVYCPEQG